MKNKSSIQVSNDLKKKLDELKTTRASTFEDVIRRLIPEGIKDEEPFNREKAAFTLYATDPTNNIDDLEVKISWSQIKTSKEGKTWEAMLGKNKETATILFIDDKGAFIRFTNHSPPVYGDEDFEDVGLEYFHFL